MVGVEEHRGGRGGPGAPPDHGQRTVGSLGHRDRHTGVAEELGRELGGRNTLGG